VPNDISICQPAHGSTASMAFRITARDVLFVSQIDFLVGEGR
jgi:hypothetical protein